MTARVTAPYGAWPSPISAADVAHAQLRLSFPTIHGDDVWWQETRPDEGGRTTIIHRRPDGETEELLPAPWNARSRVHEYGGRSYLPIPVGDGYGIVFPNYEDQRLHRLDPTDSKPHPLTPEAAVPAGLRYADFVLSPDGTEVWCVCEGHVLTGRQGDAAQDEAAAGGAQAPGGAGAGASGGPAGPGAPGAPGGGAANEVRRAIVAVPLDGSAADNPAAIRELVSGANFYASPTPSPDGGHLAWVQWNHPRMPWDGTEVRVGVLDDGKVERARTVKGGLNESALAPAWRDRANLYVVSDWSGWWNIYEVGLYGGSPAAQYPAEEEFAGPLWQLGSRPYVVLADGRLAVLHGQGDQRLGIYDPETAELTDLDLPYTDWQMSLSGDGQTIVGIAGGPTTPPTVVRVDAGQGDQGGQDGGAGGARHTELRRELDTLPDAALLPTPRAETLEGPFGRPVYAYVFPPTNPAVEAPAGELPPYVVFVHGGPTGRVSSVLNLERAYFTSRGIGVIDVNYGGSTGYGRAYRERLRKQWGLVDVEDAVAAVQALAAAGEADPERLAIRGGSAGGWTTLVAVTKTSVFKAATSYYGVSDLAAFTQETHDFESRYLFGLIGPLPGFERAYEERSPLGHAHDASCPVLLLQGLDDPIVPPAQSEKFAAALADRDIPYAYLTFEGESHGFRRADTVITCLESELSFYGRVLGFDPPDVPKLELTVGKRPTPPERPISPP
jgi:dienelactone hydrolase